MDNDRKNIISVITSPLGFFTLSLLIVEGFLSIVLIFSQENNLIFKFTGMIVGALLFLVVVILVFVVVWRKPANLTLEGKHHMELEKLNYITYDKEAKNLTENENFKKYITQINEQSNKKY